jgi:1-acyl-sn-glycerol-3-phosphate acyltransferase
MAELPTDGLVLDVVASLYTDLHGHAPEELTLDTDLRSGLGIDSLGMVELLDRVGGAAGVVLGEDVLARAATPRDLARAIEGATRRGQETVPGAPGAAGSWLPGRPAGAVPRATSLAPGSFSTLNEALARHAAVHPHQVTIVLLGPDGSGVAEEITYGELHSEAQTIASALLAEGLSFGERVAIMLPTERAYFSIFCGILLAGGVPVPLYPPRPAGLKQDMARLAGVLRNAGAGALVTVPEAVAVARMLAVEVPSIRLVRTPRALSTHRGGRTPLPEPEVGADDLALIQYTSGSTGDPKGVVLTHRQLLANVRAMAEAAQVTTDDVVVSWLPLYHDMGLIGVWHTPLVIGMPLVVMSPLAFLARPARWLEAISTYRGTISAAANFAFQLCTERVADSEVARLDLSSWRLAFNGSEPVGQAVLEGFVRRFAPAGFRREAMCPAYGLAEAGVGIAFSPPGRGPRVELVSRTLLARSGRIVAVLPDDPAAMPVVGCGYPLPGYEIRIAGPGGFALGERAEGRVECRGPSLTEGYFGNESATAALWQHGWLDTGDLGYLADGELFLTGRAKDLIIRGGRNLHPEDVEAALRGVDGVEGGVAAFAVADPREGTERLAVVAETSVKAPDVRAALEREIRRRVTEVAGVPPDEIVLVPAGSVRRTPSGKVRRAATREALERGELGKPAPPVAVQLAAVARSELPLAGAHLARLVGGWLFAAYASLVAVCVASLAAAAIHLPLPSRARWVLTRRAARALSVLTGIAVRVDGALPPTSAPAIVVANHMSFVDAVALVLVSEDPLVFVTSTDFQSKPIVGSFLRRLGCAFVARDAPARTPGDVADLVRRVEAGERLAIFPEGSITLSPGVRPFHLGPFAVAAATGCAIVPVAIRGTRAVLPPGSRRPRRSPVSVVVGKPVEPPGAADFATEVAMAEDVRRALADLSGLPLVGAGER